MHLLWSVLVRFTIRADVSCLYIAAWCVFPIKPRYHGVLPNASYIQAYCMGLQQNGRRTSSLIDVFSAYLSLLLSPCVIPWRSHVMWRTLVGNRSYRADTDRRRWDKLAARRCFAAVCILKCEFFTCHYLYLNKFYEILHYGPPSVSFHLIPPEHWLIPRTGGGRHRESESCPAYQWISNIPVPDTNAAFVEIGPLSTASMWVRVYVISNPFQAFPQDYAIFRLFLFFPCLYEHLMRSPLHLSIYQCGCTSRETSVVLWAIRAMALRWAFSTTRGVRTEVCFI